MPSLSIVILDCTPSPLVTLLGDLAVSLLVVFFLVFSVSSLPLYPAVISHLL